MTRKFSHYQANNDYLERVKANPELAAPMTSPNPPTLPEAAISGAEPGCLNVEAILRDAKTYCETRHPDPRDAKLLIALLHDALLFKTSALEAAQPAQGEPRKRYEIAAFRATPSSSAT